MRFMKNKTAMAIALLGLLPIIVIIVVFSLGGGKAAMAPFSPDAQRKIMEDYTDKLNNRNADIIFYKRDPDGPSNLKARRINALNDQGLDLARYGSYDYHVLIINELDGSLRLSIEELQTVNKLLKEKNFRIVYLGSKFRQLVDNSIISDLPSEGTKSILTFYDKHGAKFSDSKFADDPIGMPIVGLDRNQEILYTAIEELANKDLFWS